MPGSPFTPFEASGTASKSNGDGEGHDQMMMKWCARADDRR